jgi:hypothetical protein
MVNPARPQPIVALAAMLAARTASARERARALARWDNEGGAPPNPGRGPRRAAKRAGFRP